MKNRFTTTLATSLVAVAFIVGCGGEVQTPQESIKSLKPHKVIRDEENLPVNYQDFAAKIKMHSQIVDDKMFLRMEATDVQTWDMAHMQVYIDIDYDANTGLSIGSGNYAIVGADYMIEDRQLFKSVSNSDWEWEWVGEVKHGISIPDWISSDSYDTTPSENRSNYFKDVEIDTDLLEGLKKEDGMKIRVSMEPINEDWGDTNNYVPAKTVSTIYLEGYQEIFDKGYFQISDDGKYAYGYHEKNDRQYLDFYDIENSQELKSYYVGRHRPCYRRKFLDNEIFIYNGRIQIKLPEVEYIPN